MNICLEKKKMYGLRLFTRERSFSKQIMRWERWRKDYSTYKIVMAACLLLLLPNIRNSCLNFPLSCVSIVLRQGGNWSLRARGDSCLFFFSSFTSERQQSYPFIKRACSRFMQPGSTEVKNGKQLLLYFVAAIKLSLSHICSRYAISKIKSPTAAGGYWPKEIMQQTHERIINLN